MASDDSSPTVRAIPLRARQKPKGRAKRQASPRSSLRASAAPLATEAIPSEAPPVVADVELASDVAWYERGDAAAAGEEPSSEEAVGEPELARVLPRFRFGWLVATVFASSLLLCLVAVAQPATRRPYVAPAASALGRAALEPPAPIPDAIEPPEKITSESPPLDVNRAARAGEALRDEARVLLEKGKLEAAIAAARRSVEADPEHALGWLILGAAQMEALRDVEAKKTFRSCAERATRGPVRECRAFLP